MTCSRLPLRRSAALARPVPGCLRVAEQHPTRVVQLPAIPDHEPALLVTVEHLTASQGARADEYRWFPGAVDARRRSTPACTDPRLRGRKRLDDRRVLNGIVWKFRTGTAWRDVPERYGPWATLHSRFRRWALGSVRRIL